MKLFELPHLAKRAPAEITVPGVPQTDMGYRFSAVRRVKPCRHLQGHPLILDEAVVLATVDGTRPGSDSEASSTSHPRLQNREGGNGRL